MKSGVKEMKKEFKHVNLNQIEVWVPKVAKLIFRIFKTICRT